MSFHLKLGEGKGLPLCVLFVTKCLKILFMYFVKFDPFGHFCLSYFYVVIFFIYKCKFQNVIPNYVAFKFFQLQNYKKKNGIFNCPKGTVSTL